MSLRYQNTMEVGDFSEWDITNLSGQLLVTAGSALNGSSFGIDGTVTLVSPNRAEMSWGSITPIGTTIRTGLRVKPIMSYGTRNRIAYSQLSKVSSGTLYQLHMKPSGGNHIVGARFWDDSSNVILDGSTVITDNTEHTIEVMITRSTDAATADGDYTLFLDGVSELTWLNRINATVYDIQTTGAAGNHQVNAPSGLGGGSGESGNMYMDDVTFRDDSSPLFPDLSGFDLVLGGGQP